MSQHSQAEQNLRTIRLLMERATIYRAISAPGALAGGVCSVGVAIGAIFLAPDRGAEIFLIPWLIVLVVATAVNLWMLRRDAVRRGENFVSPAMKLALRAMLPALLAGGLCAVVSTRGAAATTAALWVLCYGVSLLAASHFAPVSIRWLGRSFFGAGAMLLLLGAFAFDDWQGEEQNLVAHGIMGATFGVFHLIYAACTFPRREPAGDPVAPRGTDV